MLHKTWKLLRLTEHLLSGALIGIGLTALRRMGLDESRVARTVQWWHARACRILGLRLQVSGAPCPGAHLLVANHISWLDVPVIGALLPTVFVSKAEVSRWPLIGWMAGMAGTLFIERGQHQALEIREQIRQQLAAGRSILFFPEGTTSDGSEVRRFHPRLLGAVQDGPAGLQPIALEYPRVKDRVSVAPFIGDDTFPHHLGQVLGENEIVVRVRFLDALDAASLERKVLATQARDAIRSALGMGPD